MLRIKIVATNRIGITSDVLALMAKERLNIQSMEVIPGQIHLKIEKLSVVTEKKLFSHLKKIPGIYSIHKVKYLPYELRQEKINVIFNAVTEGIIAIDEEGKITMINPAAEEIIQFPKDEVIGEHIGRILNYDIPILDTLETGQSYENTEIKIETVKGRSHYFTSGRPITDERKRILGAVATIKDIHDVRKLYHTIHQSSTITFDDIIFTSQIMGEVISFARRAAQTHSTVLLKGESGTGKELFARAIHASSLRKHQPFVPINCAALPDTLLESELFGYEEGTFTGAKKGGKQGLFELADQGTIFLDEIGEIPPHIQVKLLRVLQERSVRRVGGTEEVKIDVRVIAATNKNLEKMIQTKEFRDDLYYRLNVIPIEIPPLRKRRQDLPLLIKHFLQEISTELQIQARKLTQEAKMKLLEYDWPGNVRELRNVLERAINLAQKDFITQKELLIKTTGKDAYSNVFEEETNHHPHKPNSPQLEGNHLLIKKPGTLNKLVTELEKLLLLQAAQKYSSTREMGKSLGVTHTTIINKCKKYGINLER